MHAHMKTHTQNHHIQLICHYKYIPCTVCVSNGHKMGSHVRLAASVIYKVPDNYDEIC
jgi:hypothetical protein